MRSKVVKRAPQASHWRRRRMALPSSVGRLSFTWLSSWEQKGQRIYIISVRFEPGRETMSRNPFLDKLETNGSPAFNRSASL
jgi:hypothetical protein